MRVEEEESRGELKAEPSFLGLLCSRYVPSLLLTDCHLGAKRTRTWKFRRRRKFSLGNAVPGSEVDFTVVWFVHKTHAHVDALVSAPTL